VAEVVNYVRAMNHGLARLSKLPVSVRLTREIHRVLLEGVRGSTHPGRAASEPELDRSRRLHAGRGDLRATPARRGAACARSPRALPAPG
jgi:Fic family protein